MLVIALVGAGFVTYTVQRSFPQVDGETAVEGLHGDVSVQRDTLGVPTITAGTSDDLFFAQGYVHAQDRFWQMDFDRHVTSGRLAELFGASQVATDEFLRTLGWRVTAEAEVAALDPLTRSYYESYADGVNAYLKGHDGADASFEYAVLGVQNPEYRIEPWEPADSVAQLKSLAWGLSSNAHQETERALLASDFSSDELAELFPAYPFDRNPVIVPALKAAPADSATAYTGAGGSDAETAPASIEWSEADSVVTAVSALVGDAREGIGSNSWVVSGDLTQSGKPLLANDPHLVASLPSPWHQSTLRCAVSSEDCAFDVSGFGFPGLPGMLVGHNQQIAWGVTNLYSDVTDLYLEKLDGDAYWRDGELLPLDVRAETIKVAGGEDVKLTIRSSGHGPILSDLKGDFRSIAATAHPSDDGAGREGDGVPPGKYAVSLAWTGSEPTTAATAIFALNLAHNFDEFRAAAKKFTVPAQNLIYADVEGNIGYQTPGALPLRGAGDGSMPQAGWDSAYDWRGYVPFEELPSAYNPEQGYIVTANNAVVAGEENSPLPARDLDRGWRAARITDLIRHKTADGPLTVADMRDIQADDWSVIGARLAETYDPIRTGDTQTDAALKLLRSWDGHNDPDSAAAAYANILWGELADNLFVDGREHPGPLSDQSRVILLVDDLLSDPASTWWTNKKLGVSSQREMLERTATDAYARIADLQGTDPANWNWGSLHALSLRSSSFGSSGIAPLEWLFNRGPYPVGGGASVVNATSWTLDSDFATVSVPSMRMVVDLGNLDDSRWNLLTGTSGHAFHPNYVDQTPTWQKAELTRWTYTPDAVAKTTTHTLTLTAAG